MTYEIKKEDREANVKRLTEIKREMLDLLNESGGILEEVFGSETMEHTMSKYWIEIVRNRIIGDNVIASMAFDIELLKDVEYLKDVE